MRLWLKSSITLRDIGPSGPVKVRLGRANLPEITMSPLVGWTSPSAGAMESMALLWGRQAETRAGSITKDAARINIARESDFMGHLHN